MQTLGQDIVSPQTSSLESNVSSHDKKKQKTAIVFLVVLVVLAIGYIFFMRSHKQVVLTAEEKSALIQQEYPNGFGTGLTGEQKNAVIAKEYKNLSSAPSLSADEKEALLKNQ